MIYTPSAWAVVIFSAFVLSVLAISYHFARKKQSASGYFAAGGQIHWAVNGVAFAGDYLSAASFLGICGMIAYYGYDGFLYSIGYLAGWIVALFVVAEPMKRLGKFTFTDALDSKFNSKGIQLTAAISTLVVSLFYLIPQMVGAGALVTPLLGLPQEAGVIMVGVIVVLIVATAGMASTTYVQFLKGGLLIIFSIVLVFLIFSRGLSTQPTQGGEVVYHETIQLDVAEITEDFVTVKDSSYQFVDMYTVGANESELVFVKLSKDHVENYWKLNAAEQTLQETQSIVTFDSGEKLYNGEPKENEKFYAVGNMSVIDGRTGDFTKSNLNPFTFIETIKEGTVDRWLTQTIHEEGATVQIYHKVSTAGSDILKPGLKFQMTTLVGKLDFISLMLALFLGTASLPHILIRYYTVPNPASARKSTIVAIAAIGLFYVLTLYMGLSAMTSGVLDLTNSNMAAPLLAKSFGILIFAIISAIAFATVLGTVSGLIVASSGAIAHDLMDRFLDMKLTDRSKVIAGKVSAVIVGFIAIILGILFKSINVSFLVGWAFAVAASANLPAIIMILFWKKTTSKGVVASILVGLASSLGLLLLSPSAFSLIYHIDEALAPMPFDNPAIISVPLSFITLVVVTLLSQKKAA